MVSGKQCESQCELYLEQYKFIVFQVTRMAATGDFVSVVNLDFGYNAPPILTTPHNFALNFH